MSRADLETLARRALEGLPGDAQEQALVRATGAPVVVWHNVATDTLARIYASARVIALILEVSP